VLVSDACVCVCMCVREVAGESPSDEDVRKVMAEMREQLLLGLSDDSETIR